MFTSETESLLYVLVENPGIVRAFGPEPPISDVPITVGALTEQSFGIDWRTLVELAETSTPFMSSMGELSVSPLRNDAADVTNVLVRVGSSRKLSTVPPSATARPLSLDLVRGRDPGAGRAVDLAERLFATGLPVYLAGARGVGAEAVALHLAAKRRTGGAVVRVRARSPELFVPSGGEGGVLLVEQFHELDVEAGDHLASELAEGMFASWQLLACGRADLAARVQARSFSADLAALVRSSTVVMPPLRERDDLEYIARAFLRAMPSDDGTEFDVTPSAVRTLGSYTWPGNLVELRSVLTRASATAAAGMIREVDLPSEGAQASTPPPEGGMRRAAERAALAEALRVSAGNVSVAARKLGVARSTLYRLLERHGLHKT